MSRGADNTKNIYNLGLLRIGLLSNSYTVVGLVIVLRLDRRTAKILPSVSTNAIRWIAAGTYSSMDVLKC